jgi:hypothetical protein
VGKTGRCKGSWQSSNIFNDVATNFLHAVELRVLGGLRGNSYALAIQLYSLQKQSPLSFSKNLAIEKSSCTATMTFIRIHLRYRGTPVNGEGSTLAETLLGFERIDDVTLVSQSSVKALIAKACQRLLGADYKAGNNHSYGLFVNYEGRLIEVLETTDLHHGDHCQLVRLDDPATDVKSAPVSVKEEKLSLVKSEFIKSQSKEDKQSDEKTSHATLAAAESNFNFQKPQDTEDAADHHRSVTPTEKHHEQEVKQLLKKSKESSSVIGSMHSIDRPIIKNTPTTDLVVLRQEVPRVQSTNSSASNSDPTTSNLKQSNNKKKRFQQLSVKKRYPLGTIVAVQMTSGSYFEAEVTQHWKPKPKKKKFSTKPKKKEEWLLLNYTSARDEDGKLRLLWHDMALCSHFVVCLPRETENGQGKPIAILPPGILPPGSTNDGGFNKSGKLLTAKVRDRICTHAEGQKWPGTVTQIRPVEGAPWHQFAFIEYDYGDNSWIDLLEERNWKIMPVAFMTDDTGMDVNNSCEYISAESKREKRKIESVIPAEPSSRCKRGC